MEAPIIKPYKTKEFDSKQSQYQHADKLPMRAIVLGPSGSGKTILLQNMILDVYRGAFARIYIFSPSIDVDYSWAPVKDYIEKVMKVRETKEEPIYFNSYDPQGLEQIVSTQHKVAEYMKKQADKKNIYQILIIIDDFSDDPRFTRHDKLLHSLYTRGRHNFVSTITSTQVFNSLSPIIRKNATALYIYRLRNYRDLESLLEELSALYDKKTLMQLYETATSEPHSFWYINLMAKNKRDMFYMNYNKKLEVED
jgi:predicted AAA+ superfamily ATPase